MSMLRFDEVTFAERSRAGDLVFLVIATAPGGQPKAFVEWYLDAPAAWPSDDMVFELRRQAFYRLRLMVPHAIPATPRPDVPD